MAKKLTESEEAAKRAKTVYKLIKDNLSVRRWSNKQIAGPLYQEMIKADEEYAAARADLNAKLSEVEQEMSEKLDLKNLLSRKNSLHEQVNEEYEKLVQQFRKLQIRVESGKNPEKLIDKLIGLAIAMAIIDPEPGEAAHQDDSGQLVDSATGVPL